MTDGPGGGGWQRDTQAAGRSPTLAGGRAGPRWRLRAALPSPARASNRCRRPGCLCVRHGGRLGPLGPCVRSSGALKLATRRHKWRAAAGRVQPTFGRPSRSLPASCCSQGPFVTLFYCSHLRRRTGRRRRRPEAALRAQSSQRLFARRLLLRRLLAAATRCVVSIAQRRRRVRRQSSHSQPAGQPTDRPTLPIKADRASPISSALAAADDGAMRSQQRGTDRLIDSQPDSHRLPTS